MLGTRQAQILRSPTVLVAELAGKELKWVEYFDFEPRRATLWHRLGSTRTTRGCGLQPHRHGQAPSMRKCGPPTCWHACRITWQAHPRPHALEMASSARCSCRLRPTGQALKNEPTKGRREMRTPQRGRSPRPRLKSPEESAKKKLLIDQILDAGALRELLSNKW